MFIDLESNDGQWFTFQMSDIDENTGDVIWGEPVEGLEVKIRSWKQFFEEKINKRERVTIWKVHPKSHANEPHTQFRELTTEEIKQERDDAIDYAIMDLKGWKDKKTGEAYPCTRGVKLALMKRDFFDRFFARCQQSIDKVGVEMEQEAAKN